MNVHELYANPNYRYAKRPGIHNGFEQVKERCRYDVTYYIGRWPHSKQCSRRATVDELWCKTHAPENMKKRERERDEKYNEQWNKRLIELRGGQYRAALLEIAKGEMNDPAGYAEMMLEQIEK